MSGQDVVQEAVAVEGDDREDDGADDDLDRGLEQALRQELRRMFLQVVTQDQILPDGRAGVRDGEPFDADPSRAITITAGPRLRYLRP